MTFLLGVGLLSASIVLYAWAFGFYRRPNPPRWTENDWITMALTIGVTFIMPLGAGIVLTALIQSIRTPTASLLWDVPAAFGVAVTGWLVARWLIRRARRAAAPAPVVPFAPRPQRPAAPKRRAA